MGKANYWKKRYSKQWSASVAKEEMLKDLIKEVTGIDSEFAGFGAGSTEFISGPAAAHEHQKGDADLHITGSNIYVEVTGPMNDTTSILSPLWFRPDKIETAIKNIEKGHDTYLAHYLPSLNLWRVVHITNWFVERYRSGRYCLCTPIIRGAKETFVSIEANDAAVRDVGFLLKNISKQVAVNG